MNIVLHIAYEGTRYAGFRPGIEEELKKALERAGVLFTSIQAASRTDAGVHAKGQVVNFTGTYLPFPPEKIPLILNRLLPNDIQITSSYIADPSFHATIDAKSKEYLYQVNRAPVDSPFLRHTSWHYPYPLDLPLMREGAKKFIGTKNFTGFVNQGSDRDVATLTTITTCSIEGDELLRFHIHGSHFHYKMVRNIVGTLLYLGRGKLHLSDIDTIFESEDRRLAGITAPPHGLTLEKVHYSIFSSPPLYSSLQERFIDTIYDYKK